MYGETMTNTQKSFIKGAAILAVAGLIVKIIGAFFRIPLANVVGTEGMGYYQTAYPVYQLLATVSTAGVPVAISKLVSERVTKEDYRGAYDTFRVAWRVLLVLGVASAILMFVFADGISKLQNTPPARYSLLAISPALFFVSILSAYRGYFQGLQYMVPTAVSQLLEQVVKLFVGLVLAYALIAETGRPQLGAMGAVIGIAVSEGVALAYMMAMYGRRRGELLSKIENLQYKDPIVDFKPLAKKLVFIAIPITLGACVMPIVAGLDTIIVKNALQEMGYSQEMAASMFGVLTGVVNPLINMPAVFSVALSMSLVPAIAQSVAQNDTKEIKNKTSLGVKMALLVGLPAATGFILLAEPMIKLLYPAVVREGFLEMGTLLLQMMAFGVLFLIMIQAVTGILQGLGKPLLPVIGLVVGAAVKVVVSSALIRMPDIHIFGAAAGSIACYMVAAVMGTIFVWRHAKFELSLRNYIGKPLLATVAMGVCVYFVYKIVGARSNALGVLLSIAVALTVYLLVLLLTKGLTREEVENMPGGNKLEHVFLKLKIWK